MSTHPFNRGLQSVHIDIMNLTLDKFILKYQQLTSAQRSTLEQAYNDIREENLSHTIMGVDFFLKAKWNSDGCINEVYTTSTGTTIFTSKVTANEYDFVPTTKGEKKTKILGKKSKENYPNGVGPTKRLYQLCLDHKVTKEQGLFDKAIKSKLIDILKAEGYGTTGAWYPASYWDAVQKEMGWKTKKSQ